MISKYKIQKALEKLCGDFREIIKNWAREAAQNGENVKKFPGGADEDIIICVNSGEIYEEFQRQDFFFANFAYKGGYEAISYAKNNRIVVAKNECYIGQPFNGYALRADKDALIIGILIRKDAFFKSALWALAANDELFKFFLTPQNDRFSDDFIRLKFSRPDIPKTLLEAMAVEYADKKDDTQALLKPLVLAFFMLVAREYESANLLQSSSALADKILLFIASRPADVTLSEVAKRFGYHPNYISALLRKQTGESFNEILLRERMRRAKILLSQTSLSVEEIAYMLGYGSGSNFHKAFMKFYKKPPREYIKNLKI